MTVSEAARPVSTPRRRAWTLALKLAVTAGAFAYLLGKHPPAELWGAVTSLSPTALVVAVALVWCALAVGAVRWRALMAAYGATRPPSLGYLVRAYFVGHFYNTYAPGGVGGDLVRGLVTRRAFSDGGAFGAVAVVFVERALGLAGLALLATATLAARPVAALEDNGWVGPLGLAGALLLIVGLAIGRRLAPWLPDPLRKLAGSLPALQRLDAFALAAALSVATHAFVALTGHVLVRSLSSEASLADAFTVVPLAGASAFLPISVGGIGVRENVFEALYARLGVAPDLATAGALAFLLAQLLGAGAGGVLHLLAPLEMERDGG